MGKLAEELIQYLSKSSIKQLEKDYEELKKFNKIGPMADSFVEKTLEEFNSLNFEREEPQQTYTYNNPEYSGLFCFKRLIYNI